MSKIIESQHLSFSYTEEDGRLSLVPALSDVSVSVEAGEYVAVLGHNGSGKSTLAKLFNLILQASGGVVIIDGKEILPTDDLREDEVYDVRKKVGMVFQNPDNQIVATIVEEDVAFGPENLGIPRDEIRRRVDSALDVVGMKEYMNHSTSALSGGQKQRVAIAGIIAMKPKCIIFDESTAMLDPLGRRDVVNAMEKLNREDGTTIIHITHYMEEAARARRVIVINDGRLFLDGTPRDVFSHVEELTSVGLETPQGTELLYKLRGLGYDVDATEIDPDRVANIVCELIEREKNV